MDLKAMLAECGRICDLPEVEVAAPVRFDNRQIGKVVEVNGRGVAVHFPGMKWNTWFSWEDGTDGRSHYSKELIFPVNGSEQSNSPTTI